MLVQQDDFMIGCLRGKILVRGINRVIVDVQGVGYDVAVSLTTLESLPKDGEAFLYIHTALRENALDLYGFHAEQEKMLFEMLLTVAGIGPRTSLQILSGISPDGLRQAVLDEDLRTLTAIPGIGKKSAQRIIIELKEKVKNLPMPPGSKATRAASGSIEEDLISSLVNLGYKEKVAVTAAKGVIEIAGPDIKLTDAVRMALKDLAK